MAGRLRVLSLLLLPLLLAIFATSSMAVEPAVVYSSDGLTGSESEAKACCDKCPCTRSIPPQCRCDDVKTYCSPSCKSCICTKSSPPQCHCRDIKAYCDKPCKSLIV